MPEDSSKIPCTVTVLTFNSEGGLRRCLESVKDFAEIIICDGGSTDATLSIAAEYGCVIMTQDQTFKTPDNKIADFAGVRNQTLKAASCKWFLILDSDEYLSKASARELADIIRNDAPETPKLYHMLRKYEVEGVVIERAGTYPSYQPRFFHVEHVIGFARKLHEKIVPKPGEQYGYLTKPTIIPIVIDIPDIKQKHNYYIQIETDRNKESTKRQLFNAILYSLRGAAARIVKIFLNFFRSGPQMPVAFEWISIRYSLRLSWVLFKLFLRTIFV